MEVPFVDHLFDRSDPRTSFRVIAPYLFPVGHEADFVVTELSKGTPNALFKVSCRVPDATAIGSTASDRSHVLVKIYGDGTDITIDRNKELTMHRLLAQKGLSSSPLVRFANGHAYEFIAGTPCSDQDMARERVWRGVARELARWHATITPIQPGDAHESFAREPGVWSTAKKWLDAVPKNADTDKLHKDLNYLAEKLLFSRSTPDPLVLGHGDLLSGNIIIIEEEGQVSDDEAATVRFIDYEHVTYCPRAFELANHFSEWAGFECDYSRVPTRTTRRGFIRAYLEAYPSLLPGLWLRTVDTFRGIPGFYWGLCALIQAEASTGTIDFDYSGYAEKRLAEYQAWRRATEGGATFEGMGRDLPLREKAWATP
ncbi:kinase-like domain-containing protein [Podospora aff. communis PSN243]|uniref:ethanolamine kinase n=1 Tax=Podospora aff. communis PSN243 TaxID=3040156 RepID=A0AAV9GTE6_9PEZI|nr:kinase-like domain-containing protein [Podospora aff. communis PSN243]